MISYEIISNSSKPTATSLNPKEEILSRSLTRCNFKVGDTVKVRRTPNRGVIKEIIYKFEDVKWEKNTPYNIAVEFVTGDTKLCNPYQLKKVNT